jgi:hypothetical protein
MENAVTPDSGTIVIRVTPTAGGPAATLVLPILKHGGLLVIPIIGFEQAGASSAQSAQKFFFNFFVSRAVPFSSSGFSGTTPDQIMFGPRFRWFGDVRVASYPQQITSGVATFAAGFATQVAQLQVNKLVQAGEFTTGLEYRISSFPKFLGGLQSNGKERSNLALIGGFGAISPLNPQESLQIFYTPPVGSSQRGAFLQQFPTSTNFTYTGFTTPDRGRFYWEYGAGLRVTTHFFDDSGIESSPAMLSYSVGQNQIVSGGLSSGVVQRVEGFYPLALGDRFGSKTTIWYLFGRVDMRIAAPRQVTPFILQPAGSDITGYNPQVNIVTVRSNRDLYTIGVGIDAVKLINTIAGSH